MFTLTTTSDACLNSALDLIQNINGRLSVVEAEMYILKQKYDAEMEIKKTELANLPPPRRTNVNICDLCAKYLKQLNKIKNLCKHTPKSVIKAEKEYLNLLAKQINIEQEEIKIRKKYRMDKARLETDIKRISSAIQSLKKVLPNIHEIVENIFKEQVKIVDLLCTWDDISLIFDFIILNKTAIYAFYNKNIRIASSFMQLYFHSIIK